MHDGGAGAGDVGKRVAALVQDQLQYCRSLRRAGMLSVMQNVTTDEECLKQANSVIMILKADVRALNACATRLLVHSEAEGVAETPASEVARSGYSVETVERIFRRFRPVDTTNSGGNGSGIQAVSAMNQLLAVRERLQAGLSARLLELKAEMDKEFGTAFVDLDSYLRTEKDTQANPDAEHCSACARYFVELCHKFQVMVHACRGLRAAKEGLNQTVLLKTLREETDSLTERLENSEAELKRIHHSYTEIINPEMAVGLENRQRHKIEEQEADLSRLSSELASLKRDYDRLLAENGRSSDSVGELQAQLQSNKEQYRRELAWLHPKVAAAEGRAEEIEGLVDQMNLKLSLLSLSHKKACDNIVDLKAQLSLAREGGPGAQLSKLQGQVTECRHTNRRLEGMVARKEKLLTVAMSARAAAQTAYQEMKQSAADFETRMRKAQGERMLAEKQKEEVKRQLEATEGSLVSAGGREARTAEELRRAEEDLSIKVEEIEILQTRLDKQEIELRDYSNLQSEFQTLSVTKKDLVYRLATTNGLLEALKEKAIKLGMGRELGIS